MGFVAMGKKGSFGEDVSREVRVATCVPCIAHLCFEKNDWTDRSQLPISAKFPSLFLIDLVFHGVFASD